MIVHTLRYLCLLLVLCFVLPAHAGGRLLVAVSTELQPAMQQLIAEYRKQASDAEITLTTGSSRALYADIRHGVPIDLFFAANVSYPTRLFDEGLAAAPTIYARNELVLWTLLPRVEALTLEMLAERKFHVVAIPSRHTSAYGQRAEQALRDSHVWSRLQAKLVTGDTVQEVARFVKNGSASVGIVTRSMLHRAEFAGLGVSSAIGGEHYKPIVQSCVVTRHGTTNPLAQPFAAFVTGASGRAILARHGYLPPEGGVAVAR